MKQFLVSLIVIIGLGMLTPVIHAETLWSEDFSDVGDWEIISDQGGGSSITASDGLAAMYVDKSNNLAAFGPRTTDVSLVPFIPAEKSEYIMKWKVGNLTTSVSWDIAIDEFDENKKFINTIWNIYPKIGSTAETGEFSKNFGEKTWTLKTKYIKPKITIHTGNAAQKVCFDYIKIEKNLKK